MKNWEKQGYIIAAIEDLNAYKNLGIALTKTAFLPNGLAKAEFVSRDMISPAETLLGDRLFDCGKAIADDAKNGVAALRGGPDGISEEACVRLRVAYAIYHTYAMFRR